jgi:UDP-N-acetylglucosamine--N-acetylmuramyl-(pentapeptide) pyrophosphoryl-undecaprenol N-acetylglucosamine transferase
VEGTTLEIVLAGGGTGGHLYPALAVADELRRRHPAARITFVGGRRGLESRLVPAAGYPLRTLALSGIKGAGLRGRARAAVEAGWAVLRCAGWMLRRRPALVIGVGGYASGPAVLAADLLGVKTMVMEQNHFPGATNRFLAKRVDAVCLPSDAARERLDGLGIVTGNPVRTGFVGIADPPGATELSVLVFGGSRGARSLNRAMSDAVAELATLDPTPRIVHQTGEADYAEVAAAYARHLPEGSFEVVPFIDDMPARFAAADLVLCRAGATTLAELAAAGRPAILVPYPYAADDHQRLNAEVVERAGGAVTVLDRELSGENAFALIRELDGDRERLVRMGRAARTLARPDAARRIADVAGSLLPGGADLGGGADVP